MSPIPQKKIGSYEIVAPLGAGGMGEVYRAHDTKLNRDVALKILPEAYTKDADRMARFAREAEVLASLNHPNIATIYGIEDSAIVMELVEGEDLQGPVPLATALDYARQIAAGLEAAHEKGIVHRDLKPANIKVTADGVVKLLDFGLAKVGSDTTIVSDSANSPTLTLRATQAGLIMGTAGYMSPEQAAGKPVDRRADIWSFGVVLWEMLTGAKLFSGETVSHTLADVLRADIDVAKLPSSTPSVIRTLIRRCLDRNLKTRLRDIGEARIAIEQYVADPSSAAAVMAVPARRLWAPWVLAAAISLIPAGAFYWHMRNPHPAPLTARFEVWPPDGYSLNPNNVTISPDGRFLVAVGRKKDESLELLVRETESGAFRRLPGTEGGNHPFWSPDSRSVGYFVRSRLMRIDVSGGPPQTIAEAGPSRGGTWNQDGLIVYAGGSDHCLMKVSAKGGIPVRLWPNAKDGDYSWPRFLPDGKHFLYGHGARKTGATFVGTLDGGEAPRRLLDGAEETICEVGEDGRTGHLIFRRGDGVMAVPFDVARMAITGDPFPLLSVGTGTNSGKLNVSVSSPGRWLVMTQGDIGVREAEPVELSRTGEMISKLSGNGVRGWEHMELSPDGTRLLGEQLAPGASEAGIWTLDLARSVTAKVITTPTEGPSVWAADGRRIYFVAAINGKSGIWVANADGSGTPALVLEGEAHHLAVSPDGKHLVFGTSNNPSGRRILDYSLEKGGKPEVLVQAGSAPDHPQFSPDGKWLLYTQLEERSYDLWVQSYPAGAGRWKVTNASVRQGRWRKDGREICFIGRGAPVMCVAVTPRNGRLEFGPAQKLFDVHMTTVASGPTYFDMSGDAKRFYFNVLPPALERIPFTMVLNWAAGLKH